MQDEVDDDVLAWAEVLADPGAIRWGIPDSEAHAIGLYLHLFDIRHESQEHAPRQSTWRFASRYLVTAWSEDVRESHRLLRAALVHAVECDRFDVERESPGLALWQALGLSPRPAFVLVAPWSHQRETPQGPLVRRSLQIDWGDLQPVSGSVLGPADTPVMLARVEIPTTGMSTATDWQGRFHFPAVLRSDALVLQASAKGQRVRTRLKDACDPDGQVVIRMDVGP